jgi:citronellyl-CoA dehydrogenase
MRLTDEHQQLRRTVREFIAKEINPTSTSGRGRRTFRRTSCSARPARSGCSASTSPRPSAAWASTTRTRRWSPRSSAARTVGRVSAMALGVQTDMATPALAKWGSDELRREFLAPAITGDCVVRRSR